VFLNALGQKLFRTLDLRDYIKSIQRFNEPTVTAGGVGEMARLWDVASGQIQVRFRKNLWTEHFQAVSGDGRTCVSVASGENGEGDGILVQDLAGSPTPIRVNTSPAQVSKDYSILALSGAAVAVMSRGGEVQRWDPATGGKRTVALGGPLARSLKAAITPNGQTLVIEWNDHTTRVQEFSTGKQRAVFPHPPDAHLSKPAISPDGRSVALLYVVKKRSAAGLFEWHWELTVWDVAASRQHFTARWVHDQYRQGSWSLTFSPDGRLLAESQGPVRLWEVATGKQLASLPTTTSDDQPLAFGGDGKLLAVACNRTIRLWDLTEN
jgi:WD40 repeat protein